MSELRNSFFVDRQVQGALARRIVVHWCIVLAVLLTSLVALEYFLGDPDLSLAGHLRSIWQSYGFFILLMLAIIPAFVYDVMKLSNRFAGPMVRLRDSIRRAADGENIKDLKFRDGDFWADVANDFNRMTSRMHDAKPQG